MISAPNPPQRSSGNKAHPLRPIYLISKTPCPGVIHIPVLRISFLAPAIDFSRYDGLVFTSKQGIEAMKNYPETWKRLRCVCVSEPTAQYAREAGAREVYAAQGYGVQIPALLETLGHDAKWLYVRPREVASEWAETARFSGLSVEEAVVYETVCNPDAAGMKVAEDGVLIFTSPSTVRCFLEQYSFKTAHTAVAIGTTTLRAIPEGTEVYVSESPSVASAVKTACEIARATKK